MQKPTSLMKKTLVLLSAILLIPLVAAITVTDPIILHPSSTAGYIILQSGTYSSIIVDSEYAQINSTFRYNTTANVTLSNLKTPSGKWNWTVAGTTGTQNINITTTTIGQTYKFSNGSTIIYTNLSTADGYLRYSTAIGNANYSIARAPLLLTPTNNSDVAYTYPPLTTPIVFTWENEDTNSNELIIARDVSFNQIVSDTYTTADTSTIALEIGDTYYWKVRQYDSNTGIAGETSPFFILTLNTTALTHSTTAIEGVVYKSGSIPISGAKVRIYNTTWSKSVVTGSNGYYLFDNLENQTTYSVQATKTEEFEDGSIDAVTTGNYTWTTHNILLQECVSGFNCFYNQKYVEFVVKNPFGTLYSGVSVSAYKGNDAAPSNTGTTGTEGNVVFRLFNEQKYRIVFSNPALSIYEELTIYPKDDSYTIYVWGTRISDRTDNISYNLYASEKNATTTWLNLTYSSNTTTTTGNFWIKDGNGSLIYSATTSSFTSWDVGRPVDDDNTQTYVWGFNATHPTWGLIEQSQVIKFRSDYLIDLKLSDTRLYNWFAIGFLVLLASLFSYQTNKNGYVLVPLFALFFWGIGWFPQGYQLSHFTVIMTALVLGALAYIRSSEKKGAYPY